MRVAPCCDVQQGRPAKFWSGRGKQCRSRDAQEGERPVAVVFNRGSLISIRHVRKSIVADSESRPTFFLSRQAFDAAWLGLNEIDVIGEFTFDLSMLHDQGEIKYEGKAYNPRICFDDYNGNLISMNEETNLHDYAFGSTSEAFGE